ncbi:MAG TPA: hypothetical protein VGX49_15560, partial [Jatrophihabitans sp.]|nr:hypothetical protein [Jatrophihabitans sp.]
MNRSRIAAYARPQPSRSRQLSAVAAFVLLTGALGGCASPGIWAASGPDPMSSTATSSLSPSVDASAA